MSEHQPTTDNLGAVSGVRADVFPDVFLPLATPPQMAGQQRARLRCAAGRPWHGQEPEGLKPQVMYACRLHASSAERVDRGRWAVGSGNRQSATVHYSRPPALPDHLSCLIDLFSHESMTHSLISHPSSLFYPIEGYGGSWQAGMRSMGSTVSCEVAQSGQFVPIQGRAGGFHVCPPALAVRPCPRQMVFTSPLCRGPRAVLRTKTEKTPQGFSISSSPFGAHCSEDRGAWSSGGRRLVDRPLAAASAPRSRIFAERYSRLSRGWQATSRRFTARRPPQCALVPAPAIRRGVFYFNPFHGGNHALVPFERPAGAGRGRSSIAIQPDRRLYLREFVEWR